MGGAGGRRSVLPAVAIRGQTEACTVWAHSASPGDVEVNFKKLMEGVTRPGLKVKVERDTTSPSPVGQTRALIYSLFADGARQGSAFTMLTASGPAARFRRHPGFQIEFALTESCLP